jgi:hypothetical protein
LSSRRQLLYSHDLEGSNCNSHLLP